MSYITNSDVLNFLNAVGADLDLVFQYLWKHVLCIEFIRLRWSIKDESSSRITFMRFFELFGRDDRKKKTLAYLKEWEGKFWITMDENIKELTEKLDDGIKAEFGADVNAFKTNFGYTNTLSSERKSEIVTRSRNIIRPDQLAMLSQVIDLLAEQVGDSQNKFYIMMDKLDERWVDESIRFKLVRALMETLKTFRRIANLKIIVALRTDVLERVVQETRDVTFQRESTRIIWSRFVGQNRF